MTKIKVWAHRGASGYAPENTLEAFKIALDMKSDGVELDIHLTKDKKLVVIHDETINRVSNGTGWVKDYTLKELKLFNYNKMYPQYNFISIPTLEEVYDSLRGTNIEINVELKTNIIFYETIEEKALKLAYEKGMQDQIIYSSFNHYSIMKIKNLDSNARLGFLYTDGFINIAEYCKYMGVDAIHPAYNNLKYPRFIDSCKGKGLHINVWNVKDKDIKVCCQKDVNSIITNFPDRTRKLINDYYRGNCTNG